MVTCRLLHPNVFRSGLPIDATLQGVAPLLGVLAKMYMLRRSAQMTAAQIEAYRRKRFITTATGTADEATRMLASIAD